MTKKTPEPKPGLILVCTEKGRREIVRQYRKHDRNASKDTADYSDYAHRLEDQATTNWHEDGKAYCDTWTARIIKNGKFEEIFFYLDYSKGHFEVEDIGV